MSSKRSYTRNTSTKARKKEAFNIHHPDLVDAVEPAFKVGSTQYYRFKKDLLMPAGRYKYIYSFLREVDLRLSLDTLNKFISEMETILSGKHGQINISELAITVHKLKSRTKLAFEPDTVKRLASVTYFDESEDLSTFDKEHAEQKIKKWDKAKSLDFFLTTPMKEFLGLTHISTTSLQDYLKEVSEMIQEQDQPMPS